MPPQAQLGFAVTGEEKLTCVLERHLDLGVPGEQWDMASMWGWGEAGCHL